MARETNSGFFEQLLQSLYNSTQLFDTIRESLAALGQRCDVSRVSIYEQSPEGYDCAFEWLSPGVASCRIRLQTLPPFDAEGVYACADTLRFPPEQREVWSARGTRAALLCALMENGAPQGFIGFEDCREKRRWTSEQLRALTLAGKLIGSFVQKARDAENAALSEDFRIALDSSTSYVMLLDPSNYRMLHCNQAIRNECGEIAPSDTCYSRFLQRETPCPGCPMPRLKHGQSSSPIEILRPDGRWFLSQGSAMRWRGREMVMVTCIDISRQKAAEAELLQKSLALDSLVQATPGGIFQYSADDDEQFVFVSENMLRLLGYTHDEFTRAFDNRFSRMVYHEDRERVLREIDEHIAKSDFDYCEYRIETKSGELKWVYDVGHLVTDAYGKRWFYVVVVDITRQKQIEEALRERNEENQIVIAQSGNSILRYDVRTSVVHNDAAICRLFSLPEQMEDYPESFLCTGYVLPESEEPLRRLCAAMRDGIPVGNDILHIRMPDGLLRWYQMDYTLVHDAEGKPSHAVISVNDNTERVEKELAYQKLQNDLKALAANCVLYQEVNLSTDTVESQEGPSNDRLQRKAAMLAPDESSSLSRSMSLQLYATANLPREERAAFLTFFDAKRLLALYATGCTQDEMNFSSTAGGKPEWHSASVRMAPDPDTNDVKAFIVINNVDQEYRERQRLEQLAYRDAMTQLLNHETSEQRIRQALLNAGPDTVCALFMIDLDNFKSVNDTMGHQTGDEALKRIAETLSDSFRQEDIVGRFGGDEFIAFICGGATRHLAGRKASMLTENIQFSFGQVVVTASVGVALGKGTEKTFEQLYAEADLALYRAKARGKGGYCLFSDNDDAAEPEPEDAPQGAIPSSVQLKTLLENMDGGIVLAEVGSEARITYVSHSYYHMMSQRLHRKVEDTVCPLQLVLPEDLHAVQDALRTAARGTVTDCAYRIAGADNAWQLLHAAPLATDEIDKRTVIGVITDITNLKQSEERYHLAENKYRLASELSKALIWEVDLATHTLYQSLETSRQMGHSGGVFPNAPDSLLATGTIHPDSVQDFRQMYDDLYAGIEGKDYTILSHNETSTYTWVRASFRFLRDEHGRAVRSIGIVEKIPNVNAEMRAFRNELRFMDLTAQTMLGTVRLNLSQNSVEKCTMAGCADREAAPDATIDSVRLPGDPRLSEFLDRDTLLNLYQEGQTWLFQEYRREDGMWVNLAVNLLRHPISGDIFAFGYYRSIDNRHRWDADLPGSKAERDSSTLLYTRSTLSAIYGAALRHITPGTSFALTVFELAGLVQLKASMGMQAVQRLLLLIGRVCRIVIEGDVAIGHLDETHIAFLRIGAGDMEQERDRVEQYRDRIHMLLHQVMPDIDLKVYCGFSLTDKEPFDEMVRQAEIACVSSGQWPGNPVIAYADPLLTSMRGAQDNAAPHKQTHLLIVDDDIITRQILCNIFNKEYGVTEAGDGEQALEALNSQPYDLVISDILMPKKTGWQLLESMNADARLREIPVVIVTSDADSESEVKALTLGAADVVVKPFVARTLQRRVSNIIGRFRAARVAEENRLYEQRFQQQANLPRFADHDELTGLYNRQAFYRRVRERLDANPDTRYMIIRWDIDNFKMLNDVLGVEAGDHLLKDLAHALRELTSPNSIYARLEADHFVDFLPVEPRTADAIFQQVQHWFENYPLDFKLTSRIGVYVIDNPAMDVSIMCDRALLALRSIKGSFARRVAYYTEELRARIIKEQQLSSEMLPALRNRQFQVYFQPQYNYDTGALIGAEALVRWQHPHRGLIPPNEFIPLFERNGFISLLDEYVWEESCRYMRKWLDDKEKLLPVAVAVNISRIDIYNPHLQEKLLSLVKRYQLPASHLRLEITESAYMQNPKQLVETVKSLRGAGFTVEMDDFGSGYSSLTTLKEVPVDILKLDMRFLSASEDESRSGNILSSVIRMAHWLKLPVLAEGVETREQAEYLKNLNCVYMQGYLFGKPMTAEAFEQLLDRAQINAINRYANVDLDSMSGLWDASAQTTLLFNNFVGAACVLDACATDVEIVRANDDFFRELGIERQQYGDRILHVLEELEPISRRVLRQAIEAASQSGARQECELQCMPWQKDAPPVWVRCTLRALASTPDRASLFINIRNITQQKLSQLMEKQRSQELRAENRRNRLLLQYLNVLVFNYDFQRDLLYYEVNQPGKGLVSRKVEHYLDYLPGSTVMHPDFILPYRQVYYEASKAPIQGTFEYKADNLGAGYRWCRGHYASVANDQGQVYSMVGIVYDIQAEKDAAATETVNGAK